MKHTNMTTTNTNRVRPVSRRSNQPTRSTVARTIATMRVTAFASGPIVPMFTMRNWYYRPSMNEPMGVIIEFNRTADADAFVAWYGAYGDCYDETVGWGEPTIRTDIRNAHMVTIPCATVTQTERVLWGWVEYTDCPRDGIENGMGDTPSVPPSIADEIADGCTGFENPVTGHVARDTTIPPNNDDWDMDMSDNPDPSDARFGNVVNAIHADGYGSTLHDIASIVDCPHTTVSAIVTLCGLSDVTFDAFRDMVETARRFAIENGYIHE